MRPAAGRARGRRRGGRGPARPPVRGAAGRPRRRRVRGPQRPLHRPARRRPRRSHQRARRGSSACGTTSMLVRNDPLLAATPELVADLQRRLAALGRYAGVATGEYDDVTRAALSGWAGGVQPGGPAPRRRPALAAARPGDSATSRRSSTSLTGLRRSLRRVVVEQLRHERAALYRARAPASAAAMVTAITNPRTPPSRRLPRAPRRHDGDVAVRATSCRPSDSACRARASGSRRRLRAVVSASERDRAVGRASAGSAPPGRAASDQYTRPPETSAARTHDHVGHRTALLSAPRSLPRTPSPR